MFFDRIRPYVATMMLFIYGVFYTEVALGNVIRSTTQNSHHNQECKLVGEVCTEGAATKIINGIPVTRDCWAWENQYECKVEAAADFCSPLKNPQAECEISGQTCLEEEDGICLRYTQNYSCDKDLKTLHNGKLPENINELPTSHFITKQWDLSSCQVNANAACHQAEESCIAGVQTKIINGVSVREECWQKEIQYLCHDSSSDTDECSEYTNNAQCRLVSQNCVSQLSDGSCQINESKYSCIEREAGVQTSNSCKDQDFAKAITGLEMSREMGKFYDEKSAQFFKGESSTCSVKLGGALDAVLGGNCCKAKGDSNKFKDAAIQMGTQAATQYLMSTISSYYTYITLSGPVAAAAGEALTTIGLTAKGAISAVQTSTAISAGGTSGGMVIAVNPVALAAMVGLMVLQQALKCSTTEQMTAMRKQAGLCVHLGSYCDKKVKLLGICLSKKESFCCYVSKLARIVATEGRHQLKRGWGSAKHPSCDGFTAEELEKLDFSAMDLAEFYEEIYANMENIGKQAGRVQGQATQNIQQGQNPRVKTYYED